MEIITIYTDGSSKGNPGPGGWSAIILSDGKVREVGGREVKTTNNRMELMSAIEGLRQVPEKTHVEINSDSEYLINGITKWITGWQANSWKTKAKKAVLNQDLWENLLAETEVRRVVWQKVAGHSGHKYNDRCDEIAQTLADNKKIVFYNGPRKDYKI